MTWALTVADPKGGATRLPWVKIAPTAGYPVQSEAGHTMCWDVDAWRPAALT